MADEAALLLVCWSRSSPAFRSSAGANFQICKAHWKQTSTKVTSGMLKASRCADFQGARPAPGKEHIRAKRALRRRDRRRSSRPPS